MTGSGLHQGTVGQDSGGDAASSLLGWQWWREGRVSAYPDWTAQVEKTPGSSLVRPREVPVHP